MFVHVCMCWTQYELERSSLPPLNLSSSLRLYPHTKFSRSPLLTKEI